MDKVTWWHFQSTSKEVIWPKNFLNYMHGLKSAILAIFQKELGWPCPVTHWDFELFSSSNHISPLLNRPQGCQGCQKHRKYLRITTMIRFAANFQPKLNELQKIPSNLTKIVEICWFFGVILIFMQF